MDFIERLGKIASPTRQAVVLLSDLLGPFYVKNRPTVHNGADIANGVLGTPMFVIGRVLNEQGEPIEPLLVPLGDAALLPGAHRRPLRGDHARRQPIRDAAPSTCTSGSTPTATTR
ncbi:peptidase associated/transthyretin-like domain-containing protein [Mycobacterium tilburgii]|uniref:hypothetical protein n=1 Tax=Mycobacterium tilburgii TaxID=44467 RepID=UPI0021B4B0A9|nr:hypothetical protein [Mycobacterium tilburgii]